jgi:hypothetical protein
LLGISLLDQDCLQKSWQSFVQISQLQEGHKNERTIQI